MSQGNEETFWSKVNNIIENSSGQKVPKCIEEILNCCGYNHPLSWENFSCESLAEIENCMRSFNQSKIQKFDCSLHGCPTAHYKDQKLFKLLPGHRTLITAIVKCVDQNHEKNSDELPLATKSSVIMKEFIKSAIENERSANNNTYSDVMRNFATYIFNMSGRSCYNVLYKNLPLPSIATVCK